MAQSQVKKICFCHYGIGWRDGINTALRNLLQGLSKKNPSLRFFLIGGEIKQKFLVPAQYKKIPELLPHRRKLTKNYLRKQSEVIAKKLDKEAAGAGVVVIENPFLGNYHLPAMRGYLLYAKRYKPKETRVFFRIHDFYKDFPRYSKGLQKFLPLSELKDMMKAVDGFLITNRGLKEKLSQQGAPKEKIFYLPNGIDEAIFKKHLSRQEKKLIYQKLKIPTKAKILLYPVRIVPRKNIEEAIFLTLHIRKQSGENYILLVSGKVDKNDPKSKPYYQTLKRIQKATNLPVIFTQSPLPLKREYDKKGKIKKFGIGDLYQIAQAILMTSKKEGFGYPYLECWFAGKIVIGRRVEEVISDFEKSGLKFDWLYKKFSAKKIAEQLELLQNKKKQSKIIKNNLKIAKKVYSISKVADQFLKIINLNDRGKPR